MLKTLGDPFLLPDMAKAVEALFSAVDARRRIVLYGDYDVDGVTSLALLARLLRAYGAEVRCFLPSRMEEGYGLTPQGVARCVEETAPELLVALDCGTASPDEIAWLAERGVECVVVDHHECQSRMPCCVALVNPKRPDCAGAAEWETLCTAGLVFKLCHALLKQRVLEGFDLRESLDLVAIGTVADLVPLVGENRILVTHGLRQAAHLRGVGLAALAEVSGIQPPFSPTQVGFQIGPRLNAAGRLGSAADALELLLTTDASRARTLAMGLDRLNRERQEVERRTLEAAREQVPPGVEAEAAIVVGGEGWHPGVVGIVAARLAREFHRPTLVIGFDEQGLGKGSGRSIEGFSLVEALEACAPYLEKFGGHAMAAGLTLRQEQLASFAQAFRQWARASLDAEALRPRLRLDGEVSLAEMDAAFLETHEALQPFGIGNPQPLFMARGVRPLEEPRILKEKHLRLVLGQGRARQEAIYFNAPVGALPRPPWDLVFRVSRNEWRGVSKLQMQLLALRSATL